MTPRQIELARHALGLPNERHCSYRNYFVAGDGHAAYVDWCDLVAAGLARGKNFGPLSRGNDVFWLLEGGAKAALQPGESLDKEDFPNMAGAA